MDSNINKVDVLAESVSASIKAFLIKENNVSTTVRSIGDFIVYLQGQHARISKYKSVESDIINYLETYDFKRKNTFDVVRRCCDTLSIIEGNIAQMSQMVAFVHKRPDRYGLASLVNSCMDFTGYCAEKMTMREVDEALGNSSTLIRRLQQAIDAFRQEDDLLKEIKLILKEHNCLLRNYPAYANELKLFLSSYPHENHVDMQYVKQRLQDLSTIDAKFSEIKKEMKLIAKYADRYSKKHIESKSATILEQGPKNLVYSDLYRVNDLINQALQKIEKVKKDFQKEERIVQAQYNELWANTVDMWKEDSDRICIHIKQILDKRPCYVDFSMDDLVRKKNSAIQKKRSDIQDIFLKYHWLERERYRRQILDLSRIGMSYHKFIQGIDEIKSSRGFMTKLYELIFCA